MPGFAFNPFSFGGQKKQPTKVPYPSGPPVLRPGQNTSGLVRAPDGQMVPPQALMGAQGPEIPDPTRPPAPPNPSLIPQAPMGPPQPPSMGPPASAQRLGVPGGQSDTLSIPPGMGNPMENASDEDINQLMQLGILPEENQGLDEQIALAEGLRNRAMPEGRDSGRVYTAASPLEHIGQLMQSYAQKRNLEGGPERLGGLIPAKEGLRQQKQANLDEAAAGRARFFDLLRGRKRPPGDGVGPY